MRPILKVVGGTGFKELALREKFINDLINKDAPRLFPLTGDPETDKRIETTRAKWIAARMLVADVRPKVRMDSTPSTSFPRTMREAGSPWGTALPGLLRRFLRI